MPYIIFSNLPPTTGEAELRILLGGRVAKVIVTRLEDGSGLAAVMLTSGSLTSGVLKQVNGTMLDGHEVHARRIPSGIGRTMFDGESRH